MTDVKPFFNYTLIRNSYDIEPYINRTNKFCYFCDRPNPTFKNTPHLIPQLLGANDTTYNFECDDCNKFFSECYENELQKFASPFLITAHIKSGNSNKFPKYKPHSSSVFSIQAVNNGNDKPKIEFMNYDPKHTLIKLNEETRTGTIEIPRKGFLPLHVYKAFLKIGLGMLPEEKLDLYKPWLSWLVDKADEELPIPHQFATLYVLKLHNKKVDIPYAYLYEAKKLKIGKFEYPHHTLVLNFANLVVQVFLPPSIDNIEINNRKNTLYLEIFPLFIQHATFAESSNLEIFSYQMSQSQKMNYSETFYISYESHITTQYPNPLHFDLL